MNSPFALLFLALQQRLKEIKVNLGNGNDPEDAFKMIDQELGQLEDYHSGSGELPPVDWPAALIDIDDSLFTNMGQNTQQAVLTVNIRLGFPPYSSTDTNTPAIYRNKALFFYELEDMVHKAVHGWSPTTVLVVPEEEAENAEDEFADLSDVFGHMIRQKAFTEQRQDLIRVRQLTYTIGMDDYSTKPTIVKVPATPVINPELIIQI